MKTIKVTAVNDGPRGQILRQHGGTVEVRSGETLENVEILPLSEEQVAHYAERGVTFSKPGAKRAAKPDFSAQEKAVSEARTALDAAEVAANAAGAGEAEKEVLLASQTALTDAEKALDEARAAAK